MCSGLKVWQLGPLLDELGQSLLSEPVWGPVSSNPSFPIPLSLNLLFLFQPLGPEEAEPLSPSLADLSHVRFPLVRHIARISQWPHPKNQSEDRKGSANLKEVKQQVGIECELQADGECISKREVLPRCGAANTITNHTVVFYRKDMYNELIQSSFKI